MKRALIFLLFAGAGFATLLHLGGGLETDHGHQVSEPRIPVQPKGGTDTPRLVAGEGMPDIDVGQGVTQMAPPRRVVWKDPLSDDKVVIEAFFPWRFKTRDFKPLPSADGVKQGVLCSDVAFERYRDPESRAEALALRVGGEDAYEALLHQRFRADKARVVGRLGEAVSRSRGDDEGARELGDTVLHCTGNVHIEDRAQAVDIRGDAASELTVWPEQDRAKGRGRFVLTHEALTLEGTGLTMERVRERKYGRIAILRNPILRVVAAGKRADGRPLFDFGPGEFRPATVTSKGRAILVHEERRRETIVRVEFSERTLGQQRGGRSLEAGRATLVAVREDPLLRGVGEAGWRLRSFHGERGVTVQIPGRTTRGKAYLATVTAERLLHDVPEEGEATTVFEGDPVILMRGELSILGPGGRLRAECRDRAWIGPLPAAAPDAGLDRDVLRMVGLRGRARIERLTLGRVRSEDVIEGDAIDLVLLPKEGGAPDAERMDANMVAVHFAALGDVSIGGTRVQGATHRLVADDLHTARPRIVAEGKGSRFSFGNLGHNQRLLGPDPEPKAEPGGTAHAPSPQRDGRWVLRRLLAEGTVDIDTSMGGPALGIPANLTGDEVSYDGLSNRATVRARGGMPAHIAWGGTPKTMNHVETRELVLDRAAGRLTARGGVQGELYVARGGSAGGSVFRVPSADRVGPALEGATLTVLTNERIDITLARRDSSAEPAPGQEQVVRITGPVTTELSAHNRIVDRMRSDSLTVALAYELRPERPSEGASAPTSRATDARDATPPPPRRPPSPLERLDVRAGGLRIDVVDGQARFLEADGGVDLEARDGHVTGQRLTYDGRRRRVEVHAGSQPARALFGTKEDRSEVTAQRMVVELEGGRARRLEAHAPQGATSDVDLFRRDATKPGQVEWFTFTYEGVLTMTDRDLTSERVRVVRRLRAPGAAQYGDASVLWSPTLRVSGRNMLAATDTARALDVILAEGRGSGRGSEVHFRSGRGADLVEVWGRRFLFDVPGRVARLTGLPGRDVRMQRGGSLISDHTAFELDMTTNLPSYIAGSRILWRPGGK